MLSNNELEAIMIGVFAIAAAIFLGLVASGGVYAIAPLANQSSVPGAAVVNRFTGTVRICGAGKCREFEDAE